MNKKTTNEAQRVSLSIVKRMSIVALLAAMSFVLTAFAQIPYPAGLGYFNFGDVITILAALLFGPIEGALAGMLGGGLADLFLGSAIYIPFTVVAKGSMALLTGFLFRHWKKKGIRFISPYIGALAQVAAYFFAYWILVGIEGTFYSLLDVVQGAIGASLAIVFFGLLDGRLGKATHSGISS